MRRNLTILLAMVLVICLLAVPTFANESTSVLLQSGQWECNSSVMTGEYSDLTDWPSDLGEVSINFTSGGLGFMSMSCSYDLQTSKGTCLYYGDTLVYSFSATDSGWAQDAYALIYFDSDQEVSQVFYDWFTANFTYTGSDYEDPTFSTMINIYDTTGTTLLTSYSAAAQGFAPSINAQILADGLTITDASGNVWSWTDAGDPFYGFALYPNHTTVAYDAGETFVAGGLAADYVLDLYLVTSLPQENSEYQDGVLGFFSRILDAILNLPTTLVEGIKNLFMPSQDEALEFRDKMDALLAERLGPAYEASDIIEDFAYSLGNSAATLEEDPEPATITMPALTVDLAGADFTFGGWEVQIIPDGFEDIVFVLKNVVNMVCTLLFVNALRNRLEGVLH